MLLSEYILQYIMKKFKVTVIAKKLNITHSAVSQWFSGNTKPNMDRAIQLEKEFGIPLTAWRDIKSYLQNNDTKQKAS